MTTLLCFSFVATTIILFPISVGAQALWGNAQLGMSPTEVLRLYPNSEVPSDGKMLAHGPKELLRMPFLAMSEIPSTVHFFFQSDRLYSVAWRMSSKSEFSAVVPRYEKFVQRIQKQYPVSHDLESKRQLNMSRFLSDKWTTAEGINISISLFDSVESILGMSASGDGGAWLRLESSERLIEEQQRQATIKKNYNGFLETWVGKNISKLASTWGAPTNTTQLPNGEIIYVWNNRSNDWQCRTSIFTKTNGKITKWQWSGNNCKAPSQ